MAHDLAQVAPSSDDGAFYVVGVGASAGGLEALEAFFREMPIDTGAAFVVVQHLSPDFKSHMEQLLARQTTMPISRVEDQMKVEPNSVYLIPPRKEMIISDGRLLLTDKDPTSLTHPIDQFFRSLAQDRGKCSVGVILSGTGSDGSRGIRDIHEAGGLVVVQSEATAQFDGMPLNAQETGVVDIVLAPEAMPAAITRYVREETRRHELVEEQLPPVQLEGVQRVFQLLRAEFGLDFSHYKASTVARRVNRRVELNSYQDLSDYIDFLQQDRNELNDLYKDLLIGVTRFFRDTDAFDNLEQNIIPEIIQRSVEGEPIRVWVAGCATGEEAYSIAMLFHEQLTAAKRPLDLKMFATDVHRQSIQTAASGIYTPEAVAEISPARRARYFREKPDGFHVVPELRQMIVFAPHNVISDAPFTQVDLVTCRNLLIYLKSPAQKKALSLFHFALKTGGTLLLGSSETPGALSDEFDVIDKRWKIFRKRRDVRLPPELRLPLGVAPQMPRGLSPPLRGRTADTQLIGFYDRLLDQYMPTSFLVDETGTLLHTFGGAERYLQRRGGRTTTNLIDLIHPDLKTSLSAALQHAIKAASATTYTGLCIKTEQHVEQVQLMVQPLPDPRAKACHYLVEISSTTVDTAQSDVHSNLNVDDLTQEHIHSLEDELQFTRENLQATIEELETSNEELQATNEELVASNEELQSTNEELHSVNEELYTVNTEHQKKIDELIEANDDMDNLLQTTRVGVIFLDHDLCIRRYTPEIGRLLELLPHDVGRPIDNFLHHLEAKDLLEQIREVRNTSQSLERDVTSAAGRTYLLRVLPYETRVGVAGIVLTLIDIQSLKDAQSDVVRFKYISDHAAVMNLLLDERGQVRYANHITCEKLGVSSADIQQTCLYDATPTLSPEEYRELFERVTSGEPETLELDVAGRDGVWFPAEMSVNAVRFDGNHFLFATMMDVTSRKRQEQELRENLHQLQLALEAGDMGAWQWDVKKNEITWSEQLYRVFCVDPEKFHPTLNSFLDFVLPEERPRVNEIIEDAFAQGSEYSLKTRCLIDDEVRSIRAKGRVERNRKGEAIRIQGICWDDTREQQTAQRLDQLASVVENANDFVGIAAANLKVIMLNPAARRMCGIAEDAISSLQVADMHSPEAFARIQEVAIPAAIRDGVWTGESTILGKSGEDIVVSQSIIAHKNAAGEATHFSTIARDIREQKQAEMRIRDSEQFLRRTLDNLSAFAGVCTVDGVLIEANRPALEAAGLTLEDVIGKRFDETPWWSYSESVQSRVRDAIQRAAKGETVRFDEQVQMANERLLWIDFQMAPMLDAQGNITHLIPSGIDIADRREAERRLATEHAITHALADEASVASAIAQILRTFVEKFDVDVAEFWRLDERDHRLILDQQQIVDLNADTQHWSENRRALRLQCGDGLAGIVWDEGRPAWIADVSAELGDSVEVASVGFRTAFAIPVSGGSEYFGTLCFFTRLSLETDDQLLRMLTTVGKEIGQFFIQMRAESALQLRDRAMSSATNGILITDARSDDCPIVYVNRGFEQITGYSATEVIGKNCRFLQGEATDADSVAQVRNAIQNHQECRVTLANYRKDGALFWNDLQITPVQDESGQVSHFIGIQNDVTARKKAEERLRTAEQIANSASAAKSAFLANVSHELRTPLTAILGFADILSETVQGEETQDAVCTIRRNGHYLLELVNDILDLSKVEADRLVLKSADCDLPELVHDVYNLMSVRAQQAGIPLNLRFTSRIPRTIDTDRTRLRQILVNLLSNAIKFTEEGQVELLVDVPDYGTDEQCLRIRVTDTGIGMSQETQEKLFSPFTQADFDVTQRYGGTGLGLSISKRLIDRLGGTLAVQSKPGDGSAFTLTLPLNASPEDFVDATELDVRLQPEARVPTRRQLTCRVLVADDRRDIWRVCKYFLEGAGATVEIAEDGQQALDLVEHAKQNGDSFDIVLMDMQMPVVTGHEATKELRRRGFQAPIIALTAGAMKGDRDKCLEAGCTDYFAKPVDGPKLVDVVHRYTASARAASHWRVLVVDDSEDVAHLTARLLTRLGHTVKTTSSGTAALRAVQAFQPNVCLIDLVLPDMSGFELVRRLRRHGADETRFFAVSGFDSLDVLRQSKAAGFEEHFVKPIDAQRLQRILDA